MNVFEFEEVHWMSSGLGNCDGSVDDVHWTILSSRPHLRYEGQGSITHRINHSKWFRLGFSFPWKIFAFEEVIVKFSGVQSCDGSMGVIALKVDFSISCFKSLFQKQKW